MVMIGFQKAYTDLVDRSLTMVKEFKGKKNEKQAEKFNANFSLSVTEGFWIKEFQGGIFL